MAEHFVISWARLLGPSPSNTNRHFDDRFYLNGNGPHRFIGCGTIRRRGIGGLGVAFLEEGYYWKRDLHF